MKITMLALLLLASAAGRAGADDIGVTAGEKVRLSQAAPGSRRLTGRVLEVQPDALVIKIERSGASERVLISGLARLEVADGRRGHFKTGAFAGLVPGFAFGFLVGSVLGCDDLAGGCSGSGPDLYRGTKWGSVTALAGGLVGLAIRTDRWNELPLPSGRSARLGAAIVPVRRGVAAGLTLSF